MEEEKKSKSPKSNSNASPNESVGVLVSGAVHTTFAVLTMATRRCQGDRGADRTTSFEGTEKLNKYQ